MSTNAAVAIPRLPDFRGDVFLGAEGGISPAGESAMQDEKQFTRRTRIYDAGNRAPEELATH
jgi:hypothetical protein